MGSQRVLAGFGSWDKAKLGNGRLEGEALWDVLKMMCWGEGETCSYRCSAVVCGVGRGVDWA